MVQDVPPSRMSRDGPGCGVPVLVQDVPGWMATGQDERSRIHHSAARCPGWAVAPPDGMGGILCGCIAPDAVQGKFERPGWVATGLTGTGWAGVRGVPPCVVSRCPGMLCGFHICAVTAYRVAGGVVVYYLLFWLSVALFFVGKKKLKKNFAYMRKSAYLWYRFNQQQQTENTHEDHNLRSKKHRSHGNTRR